MIDAVFSKSGDPRYYWTEHVKTHDTDLALTWYDIGEPLLIHTEPNQPPNPRPYGVCTVLVPALSGAAHLQRPAGARQAVEARARGPALQHLGAGLLGELDGAALRTSGLREMKAIFDTRAESGYDDDIVRRYHFPNRYLG